MLKLTDEQKALVTSYGHLFNNTGGNDVVELIERKGVTYFNNALVAELQACYQSQLRLLEQLAPRIDKLQAALEGLVGETNPDELKKMRAYLAEACPEDERGPILGAIDVLLEGSKC